MLMDILWDQLEQVVQLMIFVLLIMQVVKLKTYLIINVTSAMNTIHCQVLEITATSALNKNIMRIAGNVIVQLLLVKDAMGVIIQVQANVFRDVQMDNIQLLLLIAEIILRLLVVQQDAIILADNVLKQEHHIALIV